LTAAGLFKGKGLRAELQAFLMFVSRLLSIVHEQSGHDKINRKLIKQNNIIFIGKIFVQHHMLLKTSTLILAASPNHIKINRHYITDFKFARLA
jgi:hypothetical protein